MGDQLGTLVSFYFWKLLKSVQRYAKEAALLLDKSLLSPEALRLGEEAMENRARTLHRALLQGPGRSLFLGWTIRTAVREEVEWEPRATAAG